MLSRICLASSSFLPFCFLLGSNYVGSSSVLFVSALPYGKTEASREAENFPLSRDGWEASELSATMFNQPFNPGFPGRIGSIQNEVFL
jgi:hypothetical protein